MISTHEFVILAPLRGLAKLNLTESRYVTYFFLSLWKMAVFCGGMALSYWILDLNVTHLFDKNFAKAFDKHSISVTEVRHLEKTIL
jgi:hypothetical protein